MEDVFDDVGHDVIEELPVALVRWYPFRHGSRVLFVGTEGTVASMLRHSFHMQVKVVGLESIGNIYDKFDYILAIGSLEKAEYPICILEQFHELLASDGVLLLGMNNRLGLRYFCGDHDPYTQKSFDSVEGYRLGSSSTGRMYARFEMEGMLAQTGFGTCKFYAVLPGLSEAVFLFADGQLPKEDLTNRLFPAYHYPGSVFLAESPLYRDLAANGMFHAMANAYLVECSPEGNFSDALCVTVSLERGRENAMLTVAHGNGTVTKEPAYSEGQGKLQSLHDNMEMLRLAGIPVVQGKLEMGVYVMSYVDAPTGQVYMRKLLLDNRERFLDAMDSFREVVLSSSAKHRGIFVDANGISHETECFDRAFLDMVPLNSFYLNGKFVFFDQEFVKEDYPVGVVLARIIDTFYAGSPELERILPSDMLYERYGLLRDKDTWLEMGFAFLRSLRREDSLADYHGRVRVSEGNLQANRRRMQSPEEEYRRLFLDIFSGADTKKLIIFGTGRYACEFMDLYRVRYPVYAIVDNNENTWGQELHGVVVRSPELLTKLMPGEYKVLVCIKHFHSVMEQLDSMGVEDYSIFDPGKSYAVPRLAVSEALEESSKEYKVGYVAGVFDLFHIGHLNILRRAKEHCDYLIVGVVSDRQVREYKKVEPFVPFEERLDMIRSCRYVDEAHEIPFEHPDTDMAWKLYHFDVQFSGSDYEHDPVWLKKKEWLEERGSTMVFFPYTQSTSSTRLKKLIEERLI